MRKDRSMRMGSRFRNRRGFALILVFSLASIVLLLGLSLVSLTQVETASSQYDQGMKVARANARLALQMAIGDLQEFAGPDQRTTATADGLRTDGSDPALTTFNLPPAGGVEQPFWTGVWDVDNSTNEPIWLVTRPLDATYTIADNTDQGADPTLTAATGYKPTGSQDDLIKLVGVGSAKPEPLGGDQAIHDVWVPKEPLISDEIVGLEASERATIGHYAYWVGDEGVKASYLIENRLLDTLHDGYGASGNPTIENTRLKQMLAHRYRFEVDGTEVDATNDRIASIESDLILRKDVEGSPSGRSYVGMTTGTFTQNDVLRRFHDFAGLHRGLLVDPIRGGLKEDLSNIHTVSTGDTNVDDLVNNFLMPYLNVSDIVSSSTPLTELTLSYPIAAKNTTFGGGGPTPKVAPVITEFHLEVWMGAPELGVGPMAPPGNPQRLRSPIFAQFGVAIELWNPYTIRLEGSDLSIRIDNPNISGFSVEYYDNFVAGDLPGSSNTIAGLDALMNGVSEFTLDATGTWWEPGEIRVFSGTYDPGSGVLALSSGTASIPSGSIYEYEISSLPEFASSDEVYASDRLALNGPIWSPKLSLRTSGGDVLQTAVLSGIGFYEMKSYPRTALSSPLERHLTYKWELRNIDANWIGYDPRSGLITDGLIMDQFWVNDPPPGYLPIAYPYFRIPGSSWAYTNSTVQSSAYDLLGYNNDASIENNIPLFELPRQEYLSLAALQMAEFPSGIRGHLGASIASISPTTSINDVFDRFFLSTVPQGTTSWTVAEPLPNSRMEPVLGTSLSDLNDPVEAPYSAEHLYLKGSFNVNSTSVEAWAALLKGVRLGTWVFDDPDDEFPPSGPLGELDVSGENQFLRFSQTAEETWDGDFDLSEDLEVTRNFIRKGMRSFTDAEIETLATEIVEAIRTRRQKASGTVGPLVSLQDFIDSGVLETAITGAGLNSSIAVGGTPLGYASSFLTQQDVLTAIAPYLTTRSDTFVIRAYGDAVNPFDASEVVARAYCEAIVQRVHQKHSTEPDVGDPMTIAGANPGEYGRQFRVIAFRWMTRDEI